MATCCWDVAIAAGLEGDELNWELMRDGLCGRRLRGRCSVTVQQASMPGGWGMGQLRGESRPSGRLGGGSSAYLVVEFSRQVVACARARQRGPAWGMLPCGSAVQWFSGWHSLKMGDRGEHAI
jgi:hypothetical protein